MKNALKELLAAASIGLGLGGLVLTLDALGVFALPLTPEKKPLFLLGTILFSALFRSLALVGGDGRKAADLQDG